jgi:hypothetical protein
MQMNGKHTLAHKKNVLIGTSGIIDTHQVQYREGEKDIFYRFPLDPVDFLPNAYKL